MIGGTAMGSRKHADCAVLEGLEPRLLLSSAAGLLADSDSLDGGAIVCQIPAGMAGDPAGGSVAGEGDGEVNAWEDGGGNPSTAESFELICLEDMRSIPLLGDIDGSGYSIVIIDTGIDLDHPFFGPDLDSDGVADRIVYSYDFSGAGDANASDTTGHGSNVASIAASSDPDGYYLGVAPGASIIALKVFPDNSNECTGQDIEEALQWVVANAAAYNIVSVNMSIAGGNYQQPTEFRYHDELEQLVSLGVVPVAATGNYYRNFGSQPGVGNLAADENCLGVGAVYDTDVGDRYYEELGEAYAQTTGADFIAPFTQRHETLLDIMAPGAAISGANQSGGVVTMHGTSQAAPHVAGTVALMQQLAVREMGRQLTFDEIRTLLRETGVTINDGDDEDDNVQNTGLDFPRLDVLSLAKAVLGSIGGNCFEDADGDGERDSLEVDCAGVTVFLDHNGSGCLDTYAASAHANEPLTIPASCVTTFTLTLSGLDGTLADVDLRLDVTHLELGLLSAHLHAPFSPTAWVDLFLEGDLEGESLDDILLDDAGECLIYVASSPYAGTYKPSDASGFALLNGGDPNGVWTLEIESSSESSGTLDSWGIEIVIAEATCETDANGEYLFELVPNGSYSVGLDLSDGWLQTAPGQPCQTVTVADASDEILDFGLFPTLYSGTEGQDAYYVRQDGSQNVQIYLNPGDDPPLPTAVPDYCIAYTALTTLTFNTGLGDDRLTVDLANGSPVPSAGLDFDGGDGSDCLAIRGTSGDDTIDLAADVVTVEGDSEIGYANAEVVHFALGAGANALDISGPIGGALVIEGGGDGTYAFASSSPANTQGLALTLQDAADVTFETSLVLTSLALEDTSVATLKKLDSIYNTSRYIKTTELSIAQSTATLDLKDNNLIIDYDEASPLAAIEGYIAAGLNYPNSPWMGTGITSSVAAADTYYRIQALGVIDNSDAEVGGMAYLEGLAVDATSILVKFTWWGDADLNGVVDANDYDQIDKHFLFPPEDTWSCGDFTYNDVIDANDYSKIDMSFLFQGDPL